MDSEIAVRGKGNAEISSRATNPLKMGVGNYGDPAFQLLGEVRRTPLNLTRCFGVTGIISDALHRCSKAIAVRSMD